MRFILALTVFTLLVCHAGLTQKKSLDHTVYDDWKDLRSTHISNDGNYLAYIIQPQEGDGYLFFYQTSSLKKDSVFRIASFEIGPESNYLVGRIQPGFDTLRQLKLEKAKKDQLPKDSLFIHFFDKDSSIYLSELSSYTVPDTGYFLVCKMESSSYEAPKSKKKKCFLRKKKKEKSFSSKGKDLLIFNTKTLQKEVLQNVVDYDLSRKSDFIVYITHLKEDTLDTYQVHRMNMESSASKVLYTSHDSITDVKKVQISKKGLLSTFFVSTDTLKNKQYAFYLAKGDEAPNKPLIDTSSVQGHDSWSVSPNQSVRFSEDESKLFIGIAPNPYNAPKDTLLAREKFHVDIWHWKDTRLQPRQLLERKQDENKTYLSVYHLKDDRLVQLETEDMPSLRVDMKQEHPWAIGKSDKKFERTYDWHIPWLSTFYLLNIETGEKKELKDSLGYGIQLSPEGKYASYYQHLDSTWHIIDIESGEDVIASNGIEDALAQDNNGSPYVPSSQGYAGWTKDDQAFWFYSEYHVWSFNPKTREKAQCLSCSQREDTRYRIIRWDREKRYLDTEESVDYFVFNKKTKKHGLVKAYPKENKWLYHDMKGMMAGANKAKYANKMFFRDMTFEDYPEVFLCNTDFTNVQQMSHTNPQQKDYQWGKVELVNWTSFNGIELEGLLYTPENLDTNKQYPMLVYFYERYDESMHVHYAPRPSASIINPTEYVSNNYIVFIPNIEYSIGHPGKSAYDCIVSGTNYLTQKYAWIDSTKMGLQGQSWGGYQTAYLVTQTNLYAAAMAGAPVSNMTSAYGGVRWGSGLNRMFQYENTQSRIGTTLWDSLDLYIENSPLFFADKVETPLLIMHNDDDGAVPWYQGIEYFSTLRRLDKEVILLNYNGDKHNLIRRANRKDLSRRMMQFFDHYLKAEPAPEWLEKGLPALDKDRKTGY